MKEENKRIALLWGGFIILIILLLFFGLSLFINGSLLLNNLFGGSKNTTAEKQDENFLGTLDIDEPNVATNSASIFISGSISEYDMVEFYVNGTKVKEKKVIGGIFNEKIGSLKKGSNDIHVVAKKSGTKHSEKSDVYNILYKSEKLKLELKEPQDNATVKTQEVKIIGSTDKDTTVQLNNSPVVVDVNGNFEKTVRLQEGDNKFTLEAEDIAGNTEKKEFTVKYVRDE